jgi:hypothetical protein
LLSFIIILENIVNLAGTDQGKALLREHLATSEYASRKSELLGRAAGVLIVT